MGFEEEQISWSVGGQTLALGLTRFGSGPELLLLPALSSVSTRKEMLPLQARLGAHVSTIAIDWPGFGTTPKPKITWRPEFYREFLRFVLERVGRPAATIAAGHGASYALAQAADEPSSLGRLCLLSPTWRGPLPTMAKRRLPIFAAMAKAVDPPIIGPAFYRLNVNGPVIGLMLRGHVYADPAWLTPDRMAEKRAVTEAPGARHASFRFVTGELDLFKERDAFLDAGKRAGPGVLVAYGAGVPRKSKAEMVALGALPNVTAVELPRGKLSFYEEFPEDAAKVVLGHIGDPDPA